MRGLYASSSLLSSPGMDNDAGIRIGTDWEPDATDLRVFRLGSPGMDNDAGIRTGIDWEPDAADLHGTIG